MKLCTYRFADSDRVALVEGAEILDLLAASPSLPGTLQQVLSGGPRILDEIRACAAGAPRHALDFGRLCAPLPRPRLFLAAGLNYRDHAAEVGRAFGAVPTVFTKLPGSEAAPFADIVKPADDDTLDYEGELGFVVGKRCRHVDRAAAAGCIAGYLVVNDLSLRSLLAPETLVLAKGGPGFGPFGPWVTTADELSDPHGLFIRTWVNGELRQDSSTSQLHFDCFDLLSHISRYVQLEPGDVVTTGSPSGSGVGFKPPRYLQPGDTVRVAIDGLGHIEQRVVSQAAHGRGAHAKRSSLMKATAAGDCVRRADS